VPNEVYRCTRDGLARLLSPRAATRVLDDALRHAGMSPDALEPDGVRDLLMGPVRLELEGILPRSGLRRTLRRLARSVRAQARAAPGRTSAAAAGRAVPAPHAEGRAELHPVTASSVYLPGIAIADPAAPTPGDSVPAPRAAGRDAGGRGAAAAPGDPMVMPRARNEAELETLVHPFAAIEGVVQVLAVGDRGEVVLERGDGLTAAVAAPLVRTATHILGRHGRLRSMVVEHATGLLFVFPVGRETAVVRTRPNVNMGAVLSARAALEEGL
jgi:predicted regulator of Ras-like GTPase activity (Roadblock/LC7/MglB family)